MRRLCIFYELRLIAIEEVVVLVECSWGDLWDNCSDTYTSRSYLSRILHFVDVQVHTRTTPYSHNPEDISEVVGIV